LGRSKSKRRRRDKGKERKNGERFTSIEVEKAMGRKWVLCYTARLKERKLEKRRYKKYILSSVSFPSSFRRSPFMVVVAPSI